MKTRIDDRLRKEAARFVLRHTCDDCCHFDEGRARCGEDWPTAEHRLPLAKNERDEVVFCKEFEMT